LYDGASLICYLNEQFTPKPPDSFSATTNISQMEQIFNTLILILNYNSSAESIRLYSSIKNISNNEFKILVLDNCSVDEDRMALAKNISREDLLFLNTNTGYAGGNNQGIKYGIGHNYDAILILNPDIIIRENSIKQLSQFLVNHPEYAAIGPRILDDEKTGTIYSDGGLINLNKAFETSHYIVKDENRESSILSNIDYVNGSALLLNKKAIEKIGLLNEAFFMYFEETEWCLRAKNNGWKIAVLRDINVYHKRSKKGRLYYRNMTRNRIWLSKKYGKNTLHFIFKTLMNSFYQVARSLLTGKRPFFEHTSKIIGVFQGITKSI